MISFINMFLTYLILVIVSIGVIVLAVICGKKLRERKDAREAAEAANAPADGGESQK